MVTYKSRMRVSKRQFFIGGVGADILRGASSHYRNRTGFLLMYAKQKRQGVTHARNNVKTFKYIVHYTEPLCTLMIVIDRTPSHKSDLTACIV